MGEHRPGASSWQQSVRVLGLFVVLSAVMTYPLTLHLPDTIENWGDPLLNAWIMAWDLRQAWADPLHIFDSNVFYPYTSTLAYSEHLLVSALLVAPINLISGNAVLAYNVLVFLTFVLSGFTAYLLGREMTGDRSASLVGGFVFAFSSYRFGEFSHIQLLTAFWMPLVLLYLRRFLDNASLRSGLAFALFFSAQVLSSYYQAFFIALAVSLYVGFVIIRWVKGHARPPAAILPRAALLIVLIALIVVPPSIPYFSVERELGMNRTIADTFDGSAALQHYLAVSPNNLYARAGVPFVVKSPNDQTLFPGLVAPALGLLALVAWRRNRLATGYFAALVALAFVLSLGPNLRLGINDKALPWFPLPYGLLHETVPGFKAMRVPARLAILLTLGLALLTTMGTSRLLAKFHGRWRLAVAPAVIVLLALESIAIPVRTTAIEVGAQVPEVYRWLADQKDDPIIFEYPTVESRWLLYTEEMERLAHYQYMSTYHWRRSITGYSGFFPPLFWAIQHEAQKFPDKSSISLLRGLNVKYVIFHTADLKPDRWAEMKRRLDALGTDLRQEASFGPDVVYHLTPGQRRGPLQVDAYVPPPTGTEDDYHLYLRVLNPGDAAVVYKAEPKMSVRAKWSGSDGQVVDEATAVELPLYFPKGLTILPVRLQKPSTGSYGFSLEADGGGLAFTTTTQVYVQTVPTIPQYGQKAPAVDTLQVDGINISRRSYRPGDVLPVHIKWRALNVLPKNYTLFVKLIDEGGKAAAGTDAEPLLGNYPTSRWLPGETIDNLHSITLPDDIPAGRYRLLVGAYALPDMSEPRLLSPAGVPVERIVESSIRITGPDGRLSSDETAEMKAVEGILGGALALRGYNVQSQADLRPGSVLRVKLYWEARTPVDVDYTGFVHLVNEKGVPVAQSDGQPAHGRFPTSIWEPGELIPDEREVVLPGNLPPGVYQLKAGMYLLPGPRPLTVQNRRGGDDETRLYLGDIQIGP